MDEKQLIVGLKDRDEKAAQHFLNEYSEYIKTIADKFGAKDPDDKEDIVSIVTLELIRNCKKNLKLTCKLITYLYTITRNLTLKYLNEGYNKKRVTLGHDISYDPFSKEMDYKTYIVRRVISRMDDTKREFMRLIIEGYSHQEIADELGYKNTNVVKTKKVKLLTEIKRELNV